MKKSRITELEKRINELEERAARQEAFFVILIKRLILAGFFQIAGAAATAAADRSRKRATKRGKKNAAL